MPVFLSLFVCLAAHGTVCRTVIPTRRPLAGISACQIEGMEQASLYEQSHPGWRARRIMCSIGSRPPEQQDT